MTEAAAKRLYERGIAAANRGDFEIAVQLWRHVAEKGYAKAQYNLGVAYTRGIGVTKDHSEALKWWRLAAEQGHAKAEQQMGLVTESRSLHRRSARQCSMGIGRSGNAVLRWLADRCPAIRRTLKSLISTWTRKAP